MELTIYLAVNCWIDLSCLGANDIYTVCRDGVPSEIILLLPAPTLSPVEIHNIHEYPLQIRRMDNSGEDISLQRESFINTAIADFQDESIRNNIPGRAKQNAEDRIRHWSNPSLRPRGTTSLCGCSSEQQERCFGEHKLTLSGKWQDLGHICENNERISHGTHELE
jgi:hypothetical protein